MLGHFTTTFSYALYSLYLYSPLRPPESYKWLISVGLFCKQCNLSYQVDLHFFWNPIAVIDSDENFAHIDTSFQVSP